MPSAASLSRRLRCHALCPLAMSLSNLTRRSRREKLSTPTRSLAREHGEYNITVNAIAPGLTISMDEVDAARDTQNQQRLQARSIKRTELPQDVVGAAVFLCAAESDFITGQTLVVDGGAQMH